MSYDIWLEVETGSDPARVHHDEPGNYTYNVDAMFALALDDPAAGVRNGADVVLRRSDPALKRFVGRPAGDAVMSLARAVKRMEADPDEYRALTPVNGWGDYEGGLDYLRRFLTACREHPKATVRAWL